MQSTTFILDAADGARLWVYRWLPVGTLRAAVQIAHGWAEHAARYQRLAEALCAEGYAVYAHDHRGHGRTAAGPAEVGFFAERDGWNKAVDDLWQLHQRIRSEHPELPILALGHSMGSFLTQQFMSEHGQSLAGVALSATNGKPPAITPLGILLAKFERWRVGPHGHSKVLHHLVFDVLNKSFEPARTPFDWLSRDPSEVDKYLADPQCGFASQVQLYIDVLAALAGLATPARLAKIPPRLPIYVFHGSRDPVATSTKELVASYRAAHLSDVEYKVYPDARHETLNETNRDEVTRDLLRWMNRVVTTCQNSPPG